MKIGNFALYALCACLLLTGCGASEKSGAAPSMGFTVEGTRIVMNALAQPVLDALGGPLQHSETASCAFDGVEKTNYYGSFFLTTYPSKEGDRIHSVWFVDDTVATEEGIHIGSTRDEVEMIFGNDSFSSPDCCVAADGNTTLTITLTDGVVTAVLYEAIVD